MVGVFCFFCVLCVVDFAVPPNKKCGILVAVQGAKIISTGVVFSVCFRYTLVCRYLPCKIYMSKNLPSKMY